MVRAVASRVRHIGGATAERRPTLTTFLWERNKLLTLLLCYELDTLVRLTPLYLFDGITRLTEQLWHLIGPRQKRTGTLAGFLLHYALVLRSLGWVALHGRTLGRLRGRIQAERRVRDRAITPLLSGKVFDDYQPTPVHRAANALAVAYCRLAGIRTAET